MAVPVWARGGSAPKAAPKQSGSVPPITVFSSPPFGSRRTPTEVGDRGLSGKRSDTSSPRRDRAKLGKTSGIMAVGAWSAREEIARMIEQGVPSTDILQSIRSGIEGDVPLTCQGIGSSASPSEPNPGGLESGEGPTSRTRLERSRPPPESISSSARSSPRQLSTDMSSKGSPRWAKDSVGPSLGFQKKATRPSPKTPPLEVKAEEGDEPIGAVRAPIEASDVVTILAAESFFDSFAKKAVRPSQQDPPPPRREYVPRRLPTRTRPLEAAKLEEFRQLAKSLFEDLIILEVKMDLMDTVSTDTAIVDELFFKFADPRSPGTGLRYGRLMVRYLDFFTNKFGGEKVGDKVFGLEAVQAYITKLVMEDAGFRTPQSFLYAVEYFANTFGFFAPGVRHPRVKKLSNDYAAKAPERKPAPFFEVKFLDWLEKAVLNLELDLQTRVACGKLRLCAQASVRHSDLAGTALGDVEWCRLIGGAEVLGLRARASRTKSGPRTWAASLLGVHPDNDNWLICLVQLLLEMHGPGWKSHTFLGCSANRDGSWNHLPPLIDEDTLTVKRALVNSLGKGGPEPMTEREALHLRWHGCKATMPTYMAHFGVGTRVIRFQGSWKDTSEAMPDLYLRESQTLVMKGQMEVLDQIRRGATVQSLEGQELSCFPFKADWSTVATLKSEGRLPNVGNDAEAFEAMERAVVCREEPDGRRVLRKECAKDILSLPPEFCGDGVSDAEILDQVAKREASLMDQRYRESPPTEGGVTLNDVDDMVDSDDSQLDPTTADMELYPVFVQLATGTGKVHKPSFIDAAFPQCGSHGTRFSDLQIGHDWGHNYSLCTKCFGKMSDESACPLLCDYIQADDDGIPTRCGRRCQESQAEGHLKPSDPGFSAAARHRCSLHSEVVQDRDL